MTTKDILMSLGLAAAVVLSAFTLRGNHKNNLKVDDMSNRLANSERVNLKAAVGTLENKLMTKGGDLEAQINELKKETGILEAKTQAANNLISALDSKTTQVNAVLAQAIKSGTKELRTDAIGMIENKYKAEYQEIEAKAKLAIEEKRKAKHEEKNDAMSIFNRAATACSSSSAPKN